MIVILISKHTLFDDIAFILLVYSRNGLNLKNTVYVHSKEKDGNLCYLEWFHQKCLEDLLGK